MAEKKSEAEKKSGLRVLLCDCGGSMTLDSSRIAAAPGRPARALCRAEIGRFEAALGTGGDVVVACTQEAPLFSQRAAETEFEGGLAFVNIRETAGWGSEGGKAAAKIAALVAAGSVTAPPIPTVSMASEGDLILLGRDQAAVDAARRLSDRLSVRLVLDPREEIVPPDPVPFPIHHGRAVTATGHMGAFRLTLADCAPYEPQGPGGLRFSPERRELIWQADLILDLTGAMPLFPSGRRDGYLRADPASPVAVERALFAVSDLVGTFDKPDYTRLESGRCAHSRSRKIGCTRCLDLCPTGAITPAGDHVAIDPHICQGCGACAGVCPTDAALYELPPADVRFDRLHSLLVTFFEAGGTAPVLLLHDQDRGQALINALGRFGRGLPANVLPLPVHEIGVIGADFLLSAVAYGAEQVRVLVGGGNDSREAVAAQIGLAREILAGLGYGDDRLAILETDEPDALESAVFALAPGATLTASRHLPLGLKRDRFRLAADHLYDHAPGPPAEIPLAAGAPYGAITVDAQGCTLCLACVGACPTGALSDNPDQPQLGFREDACIQCGLCRVTCPESVISLVPRLVFGAAARERRVLHEAEPFACIRCGKPFGVKASVDRILEKLAGHPGFAGNAQALDRIKMCQDCRVQVQFEAPSPMATKPRPRPRSTDDYLRDRDKKNSRD